MKTRLLEYLICPQCRKSHFKTLVFRGDDADDIVEGAIVCCDCNQWFPVMDSIPVVSVNPVIVDKWKRTVRNAWSGAYDFSTFSNPSSDRGGESSEYQEQIDFYEQEASRYDSEITDTVFWRSFAKQTVHEWAASEKARSGTVLEIGCGTGASTTALAASGCRVVALDICLAAAKVAHNKLKSLGLNESVDFIVSEAETLPFRPELFRSCIFSGVLHHVSEPLRVLKQIAGALDKEGVVYGHENNASAFRFMFDILMKIKQLWHEEAGTHPLMKSREVKSWGIQAGLSIKTKSIVFLPPHFFNLFPRRIAEVILAFTNGLFGFIPWLRDQGGLLIISGVKKLTKKP